MNFRISLYIWKCMILSPAYCLMNYTFQGGVNPKNNGVQNTRVTENLLKVENSECYSPSKVTPFYSISVHN